MTPEEKLVAACGPLPERGVPVCWLDIPSAAVARIAGAAGFPAAVIDREHGAIGIETAAAMMLALRAEGAAPFVRVPDLGKGAIQHALDSGAAGIVVPYVETPAQAVEAVRAAHYPPLGARGAAGGVIAATRYGADADYAGTWAERDFLAVQIESRAGLAAAPEIAAVPGVDMLFFGPFDYSQDAGLDPAADGAALTAAFAEVVAAAKGAGRLAGVFPWPGARDVHLTGAAMVARASDVATLAEGLRQALA
ncbi:MAG: aldolase/citrate lyase family protein [Pseudomonadota bacterium]